VRGKNLLGRRCFFGKNQRFLPKKQRRPLKSLFARLSSEARNSAYQIALLFISRSLFAKYLFNCYRLSKPRVLQGGRLLRPLSILPFTQSPVTKKAYFISQKPNLVVTPKFSVQNCLYFVLFLK
jgi:hypothetical protein